MKKPILINTLSLCSLSLALGQAIAPGQDMPQRSQSKKPNIIDIYADINLLK